MTDLRICCIASHAINNALEGHNIASIRIIEAAIGAGIDVKVVTLEDTQTPPIKDYYPIKTFSSKKRKTSIFPPTQETIYSFATMLKSKKLDCDIIHLLNVTKEIFLLISKLIRIDKPCISHLYHSSLPFSFQLNFKFRLLLMNLGFFNYVFCSNKLLFNYLIKKTKLYKDKVYYVPYPIDIKRFRPQNKQKLREKHDFPMDAPIIIYVGQIDPNRGFFDLLKAFKIILRKIPKALLYICHPNLKGEEKIYHRFFQSFIGQKLKDNIVISGPNSFIEESYSMADVVTFPFKQPYWITAPPLVLLEAMASATPIVTTPLDVIKEIGENKKNMFFSTPGDIDSLVNAIIYAINNKEEADEIGLRAREYIIKNFSMERVGLYLNEAYKKLYPEY